MSFTNVQVDTADIPAAETIDWQPMPLAHKREVLTQSLIVSGLVFVASCLPALLAPRPEGVTPVLWMLCALVAAVGFLATRLALAKVSHKGYALREHDIAYRSGMFWRKQVLLPFNRVQHVEVASGPLQRRFDLATLKFYTAGGSSVDLAIGGLMSAEAERLRTYILSRSALAQDYLTPDE